MLNETALVTSTPPPYPSLHNILSSNTRTSQPQVRLEHPHTSHDDTSTMSGHAEAMANPKFTPFVHNRCHDEPGIETKSQGYSMDVDIYISRLRIQF